MEHSYISERSTLNPKSESHKNFHEPFSFWVPFSIKMIKSVYIYIDIQTNIIQPEKYLFLYFILI